MNVESTDIASILAITTIEFGPVTAAAIFEKSVKNDSTTVLDMNPYTSIASFEYFPSKNLGIIICIAKVIPFIRPAAIPITSRFAPPVDITSDIQIHPTIHIHITNTFFLVILSLNTTAPNIDTHIGFVNISTVATDIGTLSTDTL